MNCPKCGSYNTVVYDSRLEETSRRRRRKCIECEYRFTTYEILLGDYVRLKREAEDNEEDCDS